jgi:hypothetical protein
VEDRKDGGAEEAHRGGRSATAEAETGRPLAARAPGGGWGGGREAGEPRRAVLGLGLLRR